MGNNLPSRVKEERGIKNSKVSDRWMLIKKESGEGRKARKLCDLQGSGKKRQKKLQLAWLTHHRKKV